MALPVIPISAETPAQANPFATGIGLMNKAIQGQIGNAYLPATLAANLMKQQLMNQITQSQAALSPEMAQAQLAQAQAQAPYTQAQTAGIYQGQIPFQQAMGGMYEAEANKTNTLLPYNVQQQQGQVFTDPILARLYQLNMANKTGAVPPSYLGGAGLPSSQNQPTMPMPNMNNIINRGAQGANNILPSQLLPPNPYATPATAPKAFSGAPFQNWALFGSPYNPIQLKGAVAQSEATGKTSVDQWNDAMNEAQTDANLGNQLSYNAQQFQEGYKNSYYKGPTLGNLPTHGWETAGMPGNLTSEQQTDNASQNMAAAVAKLTMGGRVTNYEMQFVQSLKPGRFMTPEAAKMTSDFLIQRAQQMQQLPQFLNAAQNQGIDLRTAQNLWNMYRQQRPVYNFQENQPYTQFNGSWRDYLNDPNAIQAAQTGNPYVPVPQFKNVKEMSNWVNTLTPNDRAWVIQQYRAARGKG